MTSNAGFEEKKDQLKNARKKRKIESGIGDKITKGGGAGEALVQSRRTKPSIVAKKPHQTMMTEQQVDYALL